MQSEWGSLQKFGLANVTLHDRTGKEIEIPICEKCQGLKTMVLGKEAFAWICGECINAND